MSSAHDYDKRLRLFKIYFSYCHATSSRRDRPLGVLSAHEPRAGMGGSGSRRRFSRHFDRNTNAIVTAAAVDFIPLDVATAYRIIRQASRP